MSFFLSNLHIVYKFENGGESRKFDTTKSYC